jgi:hypothetical protein
MSRPETGGPARDGHRERPGAGWSPGPPRAVPAGVLPLRALPAPV